MMTRLILNMLLFSVAKALFKIAQRSHKGTLTSKSNVAGSDAVLNFALDPNVSGADQCRACANGLPRTSKL